MAAPALRTLAWAGAALAAAGALAGLALQGERPEAGLSRFQPAGVMVDRDPARAAAAELRRGGRSWRYQRTPAGWAAAPGSAGPRDPAPAIELGLRLLHGSVPQRVMDAEESRAMDLAEVGLAPPVLAVKVEFPGEAPFTVEIGHRNPQGLARYARVAGRAEVLLLNAFAADPWLALSEAP